MRCTWKVPSRMRVRVEMLLCIAMCSWCFATSDRTPATCAVKIRGGDGGTAVPDEIARRNGFRNLGKIGNLEDMYLFRANGDANFGLRSDNGIPARRREEQLRAEENVEFVVGQMVQKRVQRSYSPPADPHWNKQWSLLNRGQVGGTRDMNVEPAWIQGITGRGVTVAVVDDGLWYTHPDLAPNFRSEVSRDVIEGDDDVMPKRNRDNHGTSCAGIVAMVKSNNVCGVGIAYESQIAGLRLLDQEETTDAMEASALGFRTDAIDVYSNSWGPYDNGFIVDGPGPLLAHVLQRGTEEGRGGKGAIYVWAAGNGGLDGDSCAMDGYVSSIYTIAIGSVDQYGVQAPYDEDCPGKLAVTFNHNSLSQNKNHIITTDVRDRCREDFRGTSAACPMLSGAVALALQANNNLTWRDVQYLIVHTSQHEGLTSNRGLQWIQNGAGLWVSNSFGFGAIDTEVLVTRARDWTNVPEQRQITYAPDFGTGIASANRSLEVSFVVENDSDILSLEHVVVSMSLSIANYTVPRILAQYHIMQTLVGAYFEQTDIDALIGHTGARRGDITISLVSPHGTESILLQHRKKDFINAEDLSWSFMSVLHWGEDPRGKWTVIVNFASSEGYVELSELNAIFYGVSETSETFVSQDCSPQCRGQCAVSKPNVCNACKHYRIAETLQCVEFCDESMYKQHHNYCIPVEEHGDSDLVDNTTWSLTTPTPTDSYTLTSDPTTVAVTPTAVNTNTIRHRLKTADMSPSPSPRPPSVDSSATGWEVGSSSAVAVVFLQHYISVFVALFTLFASIPSL